MRLSSVDFPVPFCPTMAIRESILEIEVSRSIDESGEDVLDTEGEILIESVLHLSRVGESDVGEGDNRRRQFSNFLKVEVQGLVLDDLLHESGRLHLVDNLVVAGCDEYRSVAERGKKKLTFCFDLACLTKLAYVPALEMKLCEEQVSGCEYREVTTELTP